MKVHKAKAAKVARQRAWIANPARNWISAGRYKSRVARGLIVMPLEIGRVEGFRFVTSPVLTQRG
jgi:hypothetical protein